jgi:hypothetical protein
MNPATPCKAAIGSSAVSRPNTRIEPASGRTSPSSIRSVVVFPAPLGPQEAVHVAGMDGQVDAVDGRQIPVALDQSARLVRRRSVLREAAHYDTDSS